MKSKVFEWNFEFLMMIAVEASRFTIFYHDFDAISVLKIEKFNFLSTRLLLKTQKNFRTSLKKFCTLQNKLNLPASDGKLHCVFMRQILLEKEILIFIVSLKLWFKKLKAWWERGI